jgi:uncharacterized protein YndB with AHSA1/START domain
MKDPTGRADSQPGLKVVVQRTFAARRERVFRAWIDPDWMEKWFSPPAMTPVGVEATVTVGGSYRIGMRDSDGTTNYVGGIYVEILPPERLVFTWAWQNGPAAADSLVTVEFIAQGESTLVIVTHEQLPISPTPDDHRRGWEGCLEHLQLSLFSGEIY